MRDAEKKNHLIRIYCFGPVSNERSTSTTEDRPISIADSRLVNAIEIESIHIKFAENSIVVNDSDWKVSHITSIPLRTPRTPSVLAFDFIGITGYIPILADTCYQVLTHNNCSFA